MAYGDRGHARFSRSDFLRIGGTALAGATLGAAGCGSRESAGGATEIILTFGLDEGGGLKTLIERFNRRHAGEIRVSWREAPAVSDEYFDQIRTEMQSGNPAFDIIGGDVIWPAQFAANGWLVDLSDRFTNKSDYLDGQVESVEYDGGVYGVPWFTDAGLFYYRQDLLEDAGYSGPPRTWDEMRDMISKIRTDSGLEYGYVFQGASDESGVVDGLEHIWNSGGNVLDVNRVVVDSPEAERGLEVRKSFLTDGISPASSGDYTTQESQAVFTNGEAIFMRNWPFVYGLLSDSNLSQVEPEKVGISTLPTVEEGAQSFSGLGGWNFLVSSASEDKMDEIWTFIEFMNAPEQQRTFAFESARLPSLKSLYEDEEVLERVPVAKLGRDVLRTTRPRPVSPYYSDMSLAMADAFNRTIKDEATIPEALDRLRADLQEITDETV